MEGSATIKRLDHLGLVAGMIDQLGIVEEIDRLLPQSLRDRHISIGQGVKAMVINGLGFNQRTLYMVSRFFDHLPVDLLIGKDIKAEHLNDSVLGRILDDIYSYGCTKLYSELAPVLCERLGLKPKTLCMDSTDFHVDGAYNSDTEPEADERVIHITHGYSRDHRPDLNQVVLNLIVENEAGIALNMQAASGNATDKTLFRKTIRDYVSQLQSTYQVAELLMDSAGYTKETLIETGSKINWISRVPETLKEAQEALDRHEPMQDLGNGYSCFALTSDYAGISQRWFVIRSEEAYRKEVITLKKNYLKKTEQTLKDFEKLCSEQFSCQADAQKQFDKFCKKHPYVEISDMTIKEYAQYGKKGRPAKSDLPSSYYYQIQGQVACVIADFRAIEQHKGRFILATNQLDHEKLPDNEVLEKYKTLSKVERGFRFLKDPQFIAASFFVKKPERVEALLFLMTLCLSVYAAIEYKIRQELIIQHETLPNQLNKQVKNPTGRWLFTLMTGVDVLYLPNAGPLIVNLSEVKQKIIRLMGAAVQKYYLRL